MQPNDKEHSRQVSSSVNSITTTPHNNRFEVVVLSRNYLWHYSPFVEPWPLFQFLNSISSWQDSLDGGSARRKAATYTQNNTNT
jgi:hypothetical protein